ncbi:hypothetical protein O5D80_000191 [Batrachochytrium dendrobatidis]|nr:hypothetical protein O5D80_000191 [Batrachochytrium dendrobatidis]
MVDSESMVHSAMSPQNTRSLSELDQIEDDRLMGGERKKSRGESRYRSDSKEQRHRSKSRERSRKDRSSRSDRDRRRDRDDRRSRSPGREDGRRSSSREYRTSRRNSFSPPPETVPLHLRLRKIENWDVPPVGFEEFTAMQAKASGQFQLPSHMLKTTTGGLHERGGYQASTHAINATNFDAAAETFLSNIGLNSGSGEVGSHTNGRGFGSTSLSSGVNVGMAGAGFGINRGLSMGMGMNGRNQQPIARQFKRLYFGNIPVDCIEERILSFASSSYEKLGLPKDPGNAAVNAYINRERNYAFVEFRSPEEATRAMALDGSLFDGNILKVRRPKDYNPEAAPDGATQPSIAPATSAQESLDKIFVGAIPTYLSDDQVQELLKTFGELKTFSLIRDSATGLSKGFAFCEYVDGQITDAACQGLNGMELGEKKLIVQRASVGSNKNTISAVGQSQLLPMEILATIAKDPCKVTRVLLLLNMVVSEDLVSDEDYQDILLDIQEECEKFGTILGIAIPRPVSGQSNAGVGKIFVKFDNVKQSASAQHALAGRKFADRVVIASFFDEDKFDQQDF